MIISWEMETTGATQDSLVTDYCEMFVKSSSKNPRFYFGYIYRYRDICLKKFKASFQLTLMVTFWLDRYFLGL